MTESFKIEARRISGSRPHISAGLWGGIGTISTIALLAVWMLVFPLHDPLAVNSNSFSLPTFENWLGTDNLGRDSFTRLFLAAGTSLMISAASTVAAALVGATLGLIAAYGNKFMDSLIMRGCDVLLSIPAILMALIVRVAVGPGLVPLIAAMAIVYAPTFARVMRAPVLILRERGFVTAAEVAGTSKTLIAIKHLLPNALTPLMIQAAITASEVVILEAALSYLGQGVQPPNPSAGLMISDFQRYMQTFPLLMLLPSVVIVAIASGWNLIADGLQTSLSPRRGERLDFLVPSRSILHRFANIFLGSKFSLRASSHRRSAKSAPPSEGISKPQVLETDNLSVRYRDNAPAVREVSFTVSQGEVVGIIGESGSGKSTIAMAVLGLLPSTATIEASTFNVVGHSVLGLSESDFSRIRGRSVSMIFQEPMSALNPSMRIGDQIAELLLVHGLATPKEATARAQDILESVHMPDVNRRMRYFPHQLSGGQRQRVVIAIAMVASPQLLVADEPTTALDVSTQVQILDLIMELRQSVGLGMLVISHDIGVISRVCDRVLVMYRGNVVEQGPVTDVLQAPQHPYTRALLASVLTGRQKPRSRLAVVDENLQSSTMPFAVNEESTSRQASTEKSPDVSERNILEVHSLVKDFRIGPRSHMRALDNVSLSVRKGETFGLVGESGSGKSTLAAISLLLQRPSSGQVLFDGEDITNIHGAKLRQLRARIQVVFQDPNDSLDPRYTISRSIAEPLRRLGLTRDEIRHRTISSLETVGMSEDILRRRPHEFSGGQKQRIAIARAMVTEPEYVVLDEPTSALDVSVQAQILNLLLDIQKNTGVSYMFISHNLAVVRHLAHQIAVMRDGRIVESADAEQVFHNPQDAYTRRLLDAILDPGSRNVRVDDLTKASE